MKLTMPGILDYIMYLFSTSFGVLIYKSLNKKSVLILYTIIYLLLVYNYSNLMELYYSTKEQNINVNKFVPILIAIMTWSFGTYIILKGLKEVQGVDFKAIATQIDYEFGTTGQTQVRIDFD